MRVELEMFQLKRENPRNYSNLVQNMGEVDLVSAFLRHVLGKDP